MTGKKSADYKVEDKQPDKVTESASLVILQKILNSHPPELSDIWFAKSHPKILRIYSVSDLEMLKAV